MNADALEAVAKLIRAVDAAASDLGLTLSGTVTVGDAAGEAERARRLNEEMT
jgi:hypothetical protein